MSLLLPLDDNGNPIPVVGFDYRGTQKLAVGGTSTRLPIALEDDVRLITVIATGACRFEVGDADIVADPESSPFLYPGIYVDIPLRRLNRYVAFVAEVDDCVVYVMSRR